MTDWQIDSLTSETKDCPTCGKRLIKRWSNVVIATYPPIREWYWWCGGCGHQEPGGEVRGETDEDYARRRWEDANRK